MKRTLRAGTKLLAIGFLTLVFSNEAFATTSVTRTSSFAYDPTSGLITQEIVEPSPGPAALTLETDYTYDSFGNKHVATTSGGDPSNNSYVPPRSKTTTYDTRGQFLITNTNALNQSETFTYDTPASIAFGEPHTHTGPNGLATSWSYDVLGRKTLEVRADGTQTKFAYLYCSGVNGGTATCPTYGAYLVQITPLAADGVTQNGPIATAYYDSMGRVIASDTQGFDGSTIRRATQYNANEQIQQKSRPYFVSGGTPEWTTYTYDVLSRVTVVQGPNPADTTTTAFHGLSVTVTNGDSQTKTTVKNFQGLTQSVTDAYGKTTTYTYDPFGNLATVTDAATPTPNVVTFTYDTRGRKITAADPDLGTWTYQYDALDELVSQTDAKSQTTTITYDLLGRITQRIEPSLTSNWTYDTATMGIGKLATASTNAGYQRTHSYDSLGRPSNVAFTVGASNYSIATTYDAASRISQITYPSGFSVTDLYTSLGYLNQVVNTSTSYVYWTANTLDAELHITKETAGSGVVTNQSFDPQTGRMTGISAGQPATPTALVNYTYNYDVLGNVLNRTDVNNNVNETFVYDNLNRVTSSSIVAGPAKSFSYDVIGNLTLKSDVGNYTYPPPGSPRPHGVVSISGGTLTTTFTYDANGNQTSGAGRSIGYTGFNKVACVEMAASCASTDPTAVSLTYDSEHQRLQQNTPEGVTTYLSDPAGSGIWVERFFPTSGLPQWRDYIFAGKMMVAINVEGGDGSCTPCYYNTDQLGSITTVTSNNGVIKQQVGYDTWGKLRFANGQDDPTNSLSTTTPRGYIGQEQMSDVGLVNLNARVYDPFIGRFLSPDTTVESPYDPQDWNRFSYVLDNPTSYSDPNGACFLGCFWKGIFKFISHNIGQIFQIAIMAVCSATPGCQPFLPVVAFVSSAVITGITTGKIGLALRAGLIASETASLFYEVGEITNSIAGISAGQPHAMDLSWLSDGNTAHLEAFAFNVVGHAVVGCAMAVASSQRCSPGALSGAVGDLGSAVGAKLQLGSVGNLVSSSILGGLASVAGGGKFGNGAVTAAFGYLFNTALHEGLPQDGGYTTEQLQNVIYNEAGGLRPVGDASNWDVLLTGLEAIGDVAVNRYNAGTNELFGFGKGSTLADFELTAQGAIDTARSSAGIAMYGLSNAAANQALTSGYDLTNGAIHFTVGPGDYSHLFGPLTQQYGPFSFGRSSDYYIRIYGGQ